MANSEENIIILKMIDSMECKMIEQFLDAVMIKSVSGSKDHRIDLFMMAVWLKRKMKPLGLNVKYYWSGKTCGTPCVEYCGKKGCNSERRCVCTKALKEFPPLLLAQTNYDPEKRTVCFYSHYDVKGRKNGAWEDCQLSQSDVRIYGHGTSSNKGPLMCWLNVIKAYKKAKLTLPVNIMFLIQGMAKKDNTEFVNFLKSNTHIFSLVNYICICDNSWLTKETPSLIFENRGLCYFSIQIRCARKHFEAGKFGGTYNEAMSDLIFLLDQLVDVKGSILITNIYDGLHQVRKEELKNYKLIDFNVLDCKQENGTKELLFNENKEKILFHRWRSPSLSIHGIEGCFAESGMKSIIPATVTGKFSITIVQHQHPKKIEEKVQRYLSHLWNGRGSKNEMKIQMIYSVKPWSTDPTKKSFEAAAQAIKHIYKKDPDYRPDGMCLEIPRKLEELSGKEVIILPLEYREDRFSSSNLESMSVKDYINGTKVIATYLNELAEIETEDSNSSS